MAAALTWPRQNRALKPSRPRAHLESSQEACRKGMAYGTAWPGLSRSRLVSCKGSGLTARTLRHRGLVTSGPCRSTFSPEVGWEFGRSNASSR